MDLLSANCVDTAKCTFRGFGVGVGVGGGIRQGTGFALFFFFSNNATEMHFGKYRIVPRNVTVVVDKFQSIHGPN